MNQVSYVLPLPVSVLYYEYNSSFYVDNIPILYVCMYVSDIYHYDIRVLKMKFSNKSSTRKDSR